MGVLNKVMISQKVQLNLSINNFKIMLHLLVYDDWAQAQGEEFMKSSSFVTNS